MLTNGLLWLVTIACRTEAYTKTETAHRLGANGERDAAYCIAISSGLHYTAAILFDPVTVILNQGFARI